MAATLDPPELTLQATLRTYGVQYVKSRFHLSVRSHTKHSNLVLFKYKQYCSPFKEDVVQESRGIILDSDDDWRVVSYPFRKFFNHGEKYVSPNHIDWASAKVQEKLDGSLITLYWYKNSWHVSTSGVPDASVPFGTHSSSDGNKNNDNLNFRQLFFKIQKELGIPLPENRDHCYMFELLSPDRTILVVPERSRLVLIGCRNITTLQEVDPLPVAQTYGWECAERYDYRTLDEVKLHASFLKPTEAEGFVVCDKNFHRIKIKAPPYVALTLLRGKDRHNLHLAHMLQIVRMNEGSEFLAYYPEHKLLHSSVKHSYNLLVKTVEDCLLSMFEKQLERHSAATNNNDKTSSSSLVSNENNKPLSKKMIEVMESQLQEKIPKHLPDELFNYTPSYPAPLMTSTKSSITTTIKLPAPHAILVNIICDYVLKYAHLLSTSIKNKKSDDTSNVTQSTVDVSWIKDSTLIRGFLKEEKLEHLAELVRNLLTKGHDLALVAALPEITPKGGKKKKNRRAKK